MVAQTSQLPVQDPSGSQSVDANISPNIPANMTVDENGNPIERPPPPPPKFRENDYMDKAAAQPP